MKIEKCSSPSDALEKLADKIESDSQKPGDFCIAFSGGESAKKMFPVLARRNMDFSRFKIFFVDERCVFPESQDSNYRWARELFIEPLNIPKERVFRLRGEECPITAAEEASKAALENVPSENGFPVFDCVVLGVGADMHTASIFPDTPGLLGSPKVYAACRPQTSKFWRITLTGKALLNSRDTLALLIGESKAPVLKRLEESVQNGDFSTPSAAILGRSKNCTVFASV